MSLSRRAFLMAGSAPLLAQRASAPRPNILLIVADSLPAHALGCYGNQEIRTPGIDLLARGGARFLFHAAASPDSARGWASLLSGLTPRQHGAAGGQAGSGFSKAQIISHLLAKSGYNCGFAGHWPFGGEGGQRYGFQDWHPAAAASGFQAAAISQEAIGFLAKQKPQQPFFLLVSYPDPGESYDGRPQKFYDLYASAPFTSAGWQPVAPNAARGRERMADPVASLRLCAAAISALDEQVQRLVAAVDQSGMRDQTLIVFTSTCGHLMGRHGLWGPGEASDPVNMFEESVMTPMIWNWPLHVPVESVRPELIDGCDLLPALCDAAGARPPESPALPGRSYLLSALNKPYPAKQPWRSLVFSHLGNTEMVRDLRYKVVLRDEGKGPNELYDLRRDPGETDNEYDGGEYVTVSDALGRELSQWRKIYR